MLLLCQAAGLSVHKSRTALSTCVPVPPRITQMCEQEPVGLSDTWLPRHRGPSELAKGRQLPSPETSQPRKGAKLLESSQERGGRQVGKGTSFPPQFCGCYRNHIHPLPQTLAQAEGSIFVGPPKALNRALFTALLGFQERSVKRRELWEQST